MILSKYFVFIHLPKTGGTFIKKILIDYAPDEWKVRKPGARERKYCTDPNHPTIRDIPAEYIGLPIFGFIRNPWDWYVSWYEFLKLDGENPLFNAASNFGKRDFRETLLNLYDNNEIKNADSGIYSWYFSESFGNDPSQVKFLKFEQLREDLIEALTDILSVPLSMSGAINNLPPMNVGSRTCYRDYYDKLLMELIEKKDKEIIDRFGYTY